MSEKLMSDDTAKAVNAWWLTWLLLIPSWLIAGFVMRVLWDWYAVPAFGLPTLGYWRAIGVAVLTRYLMPHPFPYKGHELNNGLLLQEMFLVPVIFLAIGGLVKLIGG